MKKVFLSWKEIETAIQNISEQINESGFKPDVIISVGRGGMIPARLISDYIGVSNVQLIEAKMYTGIGTRNSKPKIGTLSSSIHKKNVLIVDDIVDSGLTLDAVVEMLFGQKANSIKAATISVKEHVQRLPRYWSSKVKEEEWIVYPWELHSES